MYMNNVKLFFAETLLNAAVAEIADYQHLVPPLVKDPESHHIRFFLPSCPLRCKHGHLMPQAPKPLCQPLNRNRNTADEWFVIVCQHCDLHFAPPLMKTG